MGDGNNILHSLMLGCAKLGIDLSYATPKVNYDSSINSVRETKDLREQELMYLDKL